jgi:hypothetical protein
LDRQKQAVRELDELGQHLRNLGANAPVLDQISNLASTISSTPAHEVEEYHSRHRLWDRVRTHDQLAAVGAEHLPRVAKKRAAKKPRKKFARKGARAQRRKENS